MSALINLTGKRFGHLLVLDRGKTVTRGEEGTVVYWLCRCDCGTVNEVRGAELRKATPPRAAVLECHMTAPGRFNLYHMWNGRFGPRI